MAFYGLFVLLRVVRPWQFAFKKHLNTKFVIFKCEIHHFKSKQFIILNANRYRIASWAASHALDRSPNGSCVVASNLDRRTSLEIKLQLGMLVFAPHVALGQRKQMVAVRLGPPFRGCSASRLLMQNSSF